jgi:hypothetical protein
MNLKIQESLRKIQEAAKKKTAAIKSKTKVAPQIKTVEPSLDIQEFSSAKAKAISTKFARNFTGDLTEKLQTATYKAIRDLNSDIALKNIPKMDDKVVLYPNNCKLLMQNDDGSGCLVIEDPPQMRTIFVGRDHNAKAVAIRLPMPYLVFTISFMKRKDGKYYPHQGGIGFRTSPLKSIDDKLYFPALPHCNVNGICTPVRTPNGGCDTIQEVVDCYMQSFWQSAFVYGFSSDFSIEKLVIRSYENWRDLKNPLDILKAQFRETTFTVKSMMENFGLSASTATAHLNNRNRINRQINPSAMAQKVNTVLVRELNSNNIAKKIEGVVEEVANSVLNSALQSK